MAGLVPTIHALLAAPKVVDAPLKAGHDVDGHANARSACV
jgi:hypothetical protein